MLKVRDSSLYARKFPTELKVWKHKIEDTSRQMGLDVPEVIYEVLTSEEMLGVSAYMGLPSRYRHWSFGKAYEHSLRKNQFGYGWAYEQVCMGDPLVAYLRDANSLAIQKSVMAHVVGHAVFLKNNFWTKHIYSQNIDELARILGRKLGGIRARLIRLGLVEVEDK